MIKQHGIIINFAPRAENKIRHHRNMTIEFLLLRLIRELESVILADIRYIFNFRQTADFEVTCEKRRYKKSLCIAYFIDP